MNKNTRMLGASSACGDGVNGGSNPPDAIPLGLEAAMIALRTNQCRWPIGNPDENGFHFCTATMVGGKIRYCEAHAWDSRLVKGGKRPVVVSFGDTAIKPARENPPKPTPVTCGDATGAQSHATRKGMTT